MAKIGSTRITPTTGALYSKDSSFVEGTYSNNVTQDIWVSGVTGQNLGDGIGLFAGSNGSKKVVLEYRTLKAGAGISLQGDANTIIVTSTGVVTTNLSLMDGVLSTHQGGTGLSTLPPNRILLGNGISPIDSIPLPDSANKMLSWDGSRYSWSVIPELSHTVTSVGLAAGSNKLSVLGNPITSSGTFTIDVNEANLNLNNVGGTLSPAKGGTGTTFLPNNRILVGNGTGGLLSIVAPTVANSILSWNGTSYTWTNASSASVTSVNAAGTNGITVSGGPITTAGTFNIALAATGVTPGVYVNPNMTVDAQGRIVSIASTTVATVSGVNISPGASVYAGQVNNNLTFRPLVGTGGIVVTESPNSVNIDVGNLSVAKGGTGATNYATNGMVYFDGTKFASVTSPISGVSFLSHTDNGFAWTTAAKRETTISLTPGSDPFTVSYASTATEQQYALTFTPANLSINNLGGTLAVTKGGTGASSLPVNQLLFGNGTGPLASLATPSTGSYQLSSSSGVVSWSPSLVPGNLPINNFAGTLGVNKGGTGVSYIATNQVLLGNGSSAIKTVDAPLTSASNYSLNYNGTEVTWVPVQTLQVDSLVGIVPAAKGGTGAASLPDNQVLLGGGTSAIKSVAVPAGTGPYTLSNDGTTISWTASIIPGNLPINNFAGTLGVNKGGTGLAYLPANQVLLGNGNSSIKIVPGPSSSGNYYLSNDGTTVTWQASTPSGVQNITAAGGLTTSLNSIVEGGVITNTGSLYLTDLLPNNAGSYGVIGGTVDRKGRLTAVTDKASYVLNRANHTGTLATTAIAQNASGDYEFNSSIKATVLKGTDINVPTLATVAKSGLYSDLLNKPTLFSGKFEDLLTHPTTMVGYGLTDVQALNSNLTAIASTVRGNRKLLVGTNTSYTTAAMPVGKRLQVSVDGNDATADGSAMFPFATISAAIAAATGLSSSNPYVVMIAPGEYFETSLALRAFVSLVGSGVDSTKVTVSGGTNKITLGGNEWSTATGTKRSSITGISFQGSTGFDIDLTAFDNTNGSASISLYNTWTQGTVSIKGRAGNLGPKNDTVQMSSSMCFSAVTLIDVQGFVSHSQLIGSFNYNSTTSGSGEYNIISSKVGAINTTSTGTFQATVNLVTSRVLGSISGSGANTLINADATSATTNLSLSSGANYKLLTSSKSIFADYSPVNYSTTVVTTDPVAAHLQAIDIKIGTMGGGGGGPGSGTVTSVGLSSSNSLITVGSTPITSSGLLGITFNEGNINLANTSGSILASRVNGLSTVAMTGDYSSLINKPTLSQGTVTSVGMLPGSQKITVTGYPVTTSGVFTVDVDETHINLNNLTGTLGVSKGGTGLSIVQQNSLLIGSTADSLGGVPPPNTNGHVLTYSGGNVIWAAPNTGATGEANTASNVGTNGAGLFKQKTGSDLEFRRIVSGAGVSVVENTDNVVITSTATSGPTGSIAPGYYKFTVTLGVGGSIVNGANAAAIGVSNAPSGWLFEADTGVLTVTHSVGRAPINAMMAVSTTATGGVFKMRAASDGGTAGSFNIPSSGTTELHTSQFTLVLDSASISGVANGIVHVFVTF